jgi:hypothetical protein
VTCPWGNRIRCHAPAPEFGDTVLGMAYVEFGVEPGAADGIARFYREGLGARAEAKDGTARVRAGRSQELIFRETAAPLAPYDGHHIAIYLADFSTPHAFLERHGLLTQDGAAHEYRFQTIIEPDTRRPLFEIEHEVRSSYNPMYRRPLVNRNPAQRQRTYQRGRDAFVPGLG